MPLPKYLQVLDENSRDSFVVRVRLPMHFGRRPHEPYGVQLDPNQKIISSAHGVLTDADGSLRYTDTSLNGTLVDDTLLRKTSIRLGKKFTLRIGNYVVTPYFASGFVVALVGSSMVSYVDACRGGEVALVESADGVLELAAIPRFQSRPNGIVISFRIESRSARVTRPASVDVSVNHTARPELEFDLRPNGVVVANGHRLEFLRADKKVRICGNKACHLLTDQPLDHECKWCGHALLKGTTAIRQTEFVA